MVFEGVAASGKLNSMELPGMDERYLANGTWTVLARPHLSGNWRTSVLKAWVLDERFLRARFDLVGGPTVFVLARSFRNAVASRMEDGRSYVRFRIDPMARTINGQSVEMEVE